MAVLYNKPWRNYLYAKSHFPKITTSKHFSSEYNNKVVPKRKYKIDYRK